MVIQYTLELDKKRHPMMVREKEISYETEVVSCSSDAARLLQEVFHAASQAEEHMYLISLDTKKHILGVFDVAHGQVSGCAITPREVFLRAIVSGAVSCIIAHNHPSGDPSPSGEDNAFTERIQEAGDLLNIRLDDSIIIGDAGYYSYHDSGVL